MASQLKPDALSLSRLEVVAGGAATKRAIDNGMTRRKSDSSMRRVPSRAVFCGIHMVGSALPFQGPITGGLQRELYVAMNLYGGRHLGNPTPMGSPMLRGPGLDSWAGNTKI